MEKDVEEMIETNLMKIVMKRKMHVMQLRRVTESVIVQCLENTQLDLIREKETAFEMWQTLENIYGGKRPPG